MSWLRRLLGGTEPMAPAAAVAPSPAPIERKPYRFATDGDNPVHRLLDAAGLPWRASRDDLTARYGVVQHPAYEWDVIELPSRPALVEGLLWPLSAQASPMFSPHLPATEVSGVTWFVDDALENLHRTVEALRPVLGDAEIVQQYNTVRCDWRFGAAAVRLVVWPPDRQMPDLDNPSHEREPRLATGCHLGIETGLKPAPSPRDVAWLAGFVSVAEVQPHPSPEPADPLTTAAPQSELEFVRDPAGLDLAPLLGRVGHSADGQALIFCHRQLYVVPMNEIAGFHVERILPAKGSGGSWLEVECRTDYGDGETKSLTIAAAPEADDLNDVAARIAAVAGKPLKLGDYYHDA